VEWTHLLRRPESESGIHALNAVLGRGESRVTVTADGEEHVLVIDPDDLDNATGGGND
jgi:hypothetical protein